MKKKTTIVLCSVLYTYSGLVSNTLLFFTFLDVIALFPLMLLGLDLLCQEKKKGIFAIAVALNALCNYVFFVAEVLFVILYYLVRYVVSGKKRDLRKIARMTGLCIFEGGAEPALQL